MTSATARANQAARRSAAEAERQALRARFPELFDDGERMGFRGKPDDGPREPGGYPLGFHQLPLEARNAWFAGWNAGRIATRPRSKERAPMNDGKPQSVSDEEYEGVIRQLGGKRDPPPDGSTVKIAGVEKRITSLKELNERYALLETHGSASAYISRADYLPITENDLRRRLAGEVVQTGVKPQREADLRQRLCVLDRARAAPQLSANCIHRRKSATRHAEPVQGPRRQTARRPLRLDPRPHPRGHLLQRRDLVQRHAEAHGVADAEHRQAEPRHRHHEDEKHQAGKGLLLGETLLKIYRAVRLHPRHNRSGDWPLQRRHRWSSLHLPRRGDVLRRPPRRRRDQAPGDRRRPTASKLKACRSSSAPSAVNFWAATNHDAAAFIEEADARYWVLDVSENKVGDSAYFAALTQEIENGGREAFAHHLINLDVTDFVPLRDVPKNNAAKREMIRRSINPFDARKWIEECCVTRQLIGHREGDQWADWLKGKEYYFHVFANAYTVWQRDVKSPVRPEPTPKGSLGEVLTNAGFGSERDNKSTIRVLPDPDECLTRLFEQKNRQ